MKPGEELFRLRIQDPEWLARFWAKVDKTDECWLWIGSTSRGYGTIGVGRVGDKRIIRHAHRASWLIAGNDLAADMELDHLCRVKACVNPSHLEQVTHAVNMRRAFPYGTECKAGHPLEGANIILHLAPGKKTPTRLCRICNNEGQRRRWVPRSQRRTA